jgi:hypothetical protein
MTGDVISNQCYYLVTSISWKTLDHELHWECYRKPQVLLCSIPTNMCYVLQALIASKQQMSQSWSPWHNMLIAWKFNLSKYLQVFVNLLFSTRATCIPKARESPRDSTCLGPHIRVPDLPVRKALRFAGTNRLVVPSVKLSTAGSRALPVAHPQVWNGLPEEVTSAQLLSIFLLVTQNFLFQFSFPTHWLLFFFN